MSLSFFLSLSFHKDTAQQILIAWHCASKYKFRETGDGSLSPPVSTCLKKIVKQAALNFAVSEGKGSRPPEP